jgi:hypothetical protein
MAKEGAIGLADNLGIPRSEARQKIKENNKRNSPGIPNNTGDDPISFCQGEWICRDLMAGKDGLRDIKSANFNGTRIRRTKRDQFSDPRHSGR